MENKHTAGQWKVNEHNKILVESHISGNDYAHICTAGYKNVDSIEIAQANAKLIAAAPELLQTLTSYIHSMLQPDHVEKWYNQYKDDETANRVLVNAIAVIKKATN